LLHPRLVGSTTRPAAPSARRASSGQRGPTSDERGPARRRLSQAPLKPLPPPSLGAAPKPAGAILVRWSALLAPSSLGSRVTLCTRISCLASGAGVFAIRKEGYSYDIYLRGAEAALAAPKLLFWGDPAACPGIDLGLRVSSAFRRRSSVSSLSPCSRAPTRVREDNAARSPVEAGGGRFDYGGDGNGDIPSAVRSPW
jgi:hypothetical protein